MDFPGNERYRYSNINPEPNILLCQPTVDRYMECITKCSQCLGGNLEALIVDNDTELKWCKDCNHLMGVDDTCSVYQVEQTVRSWTTEHCSCGNSDMEQYILRQKQSGEYYLQCTQCNRKHVITNNDTSASPAHCKLKEKYVCKCGNKDPAAILCKYYDSTKEISGCHCTICKHEWTLKDIDEYSDIVDTSLFEKTSNDHNITAKSRPAMKKPIEVIEDVHKGDHIAWWSCVLGIWQHALVKSVDKARNEVEVICCNKLRGNKLFFGLTEAIAHIVQERLKLHRQKFFQIIYDGPCLDNKTALERATGRIGETLYNTLAYSCEDFIRWAKTNIKTSEQGDTLTSTLNKTTDISTYMAAVQPVLTMVADAVEQKVIPSKFLAKYIGIAGVVTVGGISTVHDIYQAYNKKTTGQITHKQFVCFSVKAGITGGCAAVGAIAGGLLGQLFIPVPFLGGFIGSSLGHLLGRAIGNELGEVIAYKLQ